MKSKDGDVRNADSNDLTERVRAASQGVVVRKFTVTPDAVETGDGVTVSWDVTLPDTPAEMQLMLNGQVVTTIGHQSFTNLTRTTVFTLSVVIDGAETRLLLRGVRVDPKDCQWDSIDPIIIKASLKPEFDARFSGSSQFSLRGTGTVVTLDNGHITIAVPVTIKADPWFDADMDVTIRLAVVQIGTSAGSPIRIFAPQVSLDVSWTFFENLASLGCGVFVENGMSKIGQAFLANIVDAELVPKVAQGFNDQVNRAIDSLEKADPQHRTYVLSFMELSSQGLRLKLCPQTPIKHRR
jgi:hypothetical protein